MKVLGISGSPRKKGTTSELVKSILDFTGIETEYITLAGKNIGPCRYCLACAKDNVCKVKDYMGEIRLKIIEADAYVIGGCNMWSTLNGMTHNLMERFFQFHHHGSSPIAGKPGIAVGVGGGSGEPPAALITSFFQNFGIKPLGSITAQGAFACYLCGYGNKCRVSTVQEFLDENGEIDMSYKPELEKQEEVLVRARELGQKLSSYLTKSV